MKIAIIGASGFIGRNLLNSLLIKTPHDIVAISHKIEHILVDSKYTNRVNIIKADVSNFESMQVALQGVDTAYYLVHMMANDNQNFPEMETRAAETTGEALLSSKVKRVIYLSGLGVDNEKLSEHIKSRHKTGDILRKYVNEVIEFRASMIIGEDSISFEIVRDIVNKSPLILLPKWSKTFTQPIGINDCLLYLIESLNIPIINPQVVEIGGPEIMSYKMFIEKYARFINKKVLIIRIPFLPENTAGKFLSFFTNQKRSAVGKCMLGSFRNEMIVTNNKAIELFPNIKTREITQSFF